MSKSKQGKILAVFDFDNTLVETNSRNLVPISSVPKYLNLSKTKFSYPIRTRSNKPQIFKSIQNRGGIRANDLFNSLSNIHCLPGMRELIIELKRQGHEIIIISDCNSVCIGHVLKKTGLQDCIKSVFTNPSWFDDKGRLRLTEFHHQDWCKLCPPNLCKGHVLQNYIRKRISEGEEFLFVAYIGDGLNDFCPCLSLNNHDIVFPRFGFDLYWTINGTTNMPRKKRKFNISSKVIPWDSGFNIKRAIFEEIRRYYE